MLNLNRRGLNFTFVLFFTLVISFTFGAFYTRPVFAQGPVCSSGNHSAVEHCSMNGVDVIKVNLNDPSIIIKPVIAPNGGLASLSSLAGTQGIAAINGDYRLIDFR